MPAPSATEACCAALTRSASNSIRVMAQGEATAYSRNRHLYLFLPLLCDRPMAPLRELKPEYRLTDASHSEVTQDIRRRLAKRLKAAIKRGGSTPMQIAGLWGALIREGETYGRQKLNERQQAFAGAAE